MQASSVSDSNTPNFWLDCAGRTVKPWTSTSGTCAGDSEVDQEPDGYPIAIYRFVPPWLWSRRLVAQSLGLGGLDVLDSFVWQLGTLASTCVTWNPRSTQDYAKDRFR
ncbi:hypothetical protein FS749_004713 [Ceratobasidium sp. UAMH 11750]|nr:hypothetical protein FS749_004713 [Ceratobasidium sp. UAMH 11750]